MSGRPDWDTYFIQLAEAVKQRSPDFTKVGAVMVSQKDHRIIACGYNGLPQGISDDIDWNDRDLVHSMVIHAEANCILYANSKFENTTMYISKSPCTKCIKLIAAAQIRKIVYKEPYKDIELVKRLCDIFKIELVQFCN
ncbi:cytidine deaminase [bacterium]|nr:cytidine deaminase [bacterium]NDC94194.1 cytidine deaminase [bacterium]NDD83026.1 cytidine deaminase [bacterium]NDG28864.1 cytidine deaminase [bacterium]